ncbi:MAG TPA: DUF11 domain-containing protein [Thermoanaerobaculia bacterium]|nr:DUF11 domain-containing protein [Thermoanaerobaculia bacterium]
MIPRVLKSLLVLLIAAVPAFGQASDVGVCCLEPTGDARSYAAASKTLFVEPNAAVVLDFEGLGNQEQVLNFYNGGLGGSGSGPGPNFGITFSPSALALIDADAGGSGNFGGEPSPDTGLFFLSGTAVMNVPAGFDTGFSFFYSAVNNPGIVNVYDGLNATGNLLATVNLPLTPFNGAPDPTGTFSPLVPVGVTFSGTAMSVDFGGTANQIVFDDVTIGSEIPGSGGNLTITKTASSTTVPFGGTITYTIVVTNVGEDDETNVVVTDELPSTLRHVSSSSTQGTCSESDNVVTCQVGTLEPDDSATITIVARAIGSGTVDNVAVVESDQSPPRASLSGQPGNRIEILPEPIPSASTLGLIILMILLPAVAFFAIRMR